ncbi:MAG: hypothetical protein IJC71_03915 [Clostridia bacterium]|nr:hypothetical protein [Clostridia bacterium]
MKQKIVDIVCLCLVGAVFGSVVLLNLIQPNRPTESELEQRKLAEMPAFTLSSLADGSYFAGVSAFISDTFLFRDQLMDVSKKMDTLRGVDYQIGGEDNFVLLDASSGNQQQEDTELRDKLAQALENLQKENQQTPGNDPSDDTASGIIVGGMLEDEPQTDSEESPGMIILPEEDMPEDPWAAYETDEPAVVPPDDPVTEESAETDVPETSEQPDEPVQPEQNAVTSLKLSREKLKLTVGSGAVVYATVDTTLEETVNVRWSVSDKNIASIAMNPQGGIDVKGIMPGTCTLTCSYQDQFKETCEITVTEIITTGNTGANVQADFLTGGMFIYGDAVYTQGFYSESTSKSYAQTALYYKQLFGENVNVSVVIAPVSAIALEGTDIQQKLKIQDQRAVLDKMEQWMDDSVNFVDVYSEMYDHRSEYLYFKSDHHWNQRGAYYAYSAFAKSIGLEPTPLDEFDYEIRNETYYGSLYSLTRDERVKNFVDTVEVFKSRKPHTMTLTTINGSTINTNNSIVASHKTYLTFISGDNPYTVINVPENPQDKNVLVLKDSFGNAFVPYLCEHFGNIIVVDVRHTSMNVYEHLKDYGLTDIVFMNNIQAANTASWPSMYLSAVGVH